MYRVCVVGTLALLLCFSFISVTEARVPPCLKPACPICPLGYEKDGNGCPTCTCINPCKTVRCRSGYECKAVQPQCKQDPCPPIAECVPTACPELNCPKIECPNGFETDKKGCQLCTCFNPCQTVRCRSGYECKVVQPRCIRAPCPPIAQCVATCPLPKCQAMDCQYGFETDIKGCQLCSCLNPCKTVKCSSGFECKVVQPQCIREPCPPHAECIPTKPVCPKLPCPRKNCEYGFEKNNFGCKLCSCFDPCKNVTCQEGSQCKVTQPQCIRAPCPPVANCDVVPKCPERPCGETAIKCQYGQELDANGCETCSCVNPCQNVTCDKGKTCEVIRPQCLVAPCLPIAQCVCPQMCIEIYAPVCGSDGKTYGNECTLSSQACINNSGVSVAHKGECESTTDKSN